ncbi:phage terminase small subunit [Yersinia pekkanenii]|uniref:Phage terminase small subunit n=1 Tax=Yersinia pekkanenii TaxID=1288385 RepID=A0A0T9RMF9_9GAMM|nr:phage terminase small subunit [Yersinia pekkanenii]
MSDGEDAAERSKASQLVTNSNVQAFLQSVQHESVRRSLPRWPS